MNTANPRDLDGMLTVTSRSDLLSTLLESDPNETHIPLPVINAYRCRDLCQQWLINQIQRHSSNDTSQVTIFERLLEAVAVARSSGDKEVQAESPEEIEATFTISMPNMVCSLLVSALLDPRVRQSGGWKIIARNRQSNLRQLDDLTRPGALTGKCSRKLAPDLGKCLLCLDKRYMSKNNPIQPFPLLRLVAGHHDRVVHDARDRDTSEFGETQVRNVADRHIISQSLPPTRSITDSFSI